MIPKTLEFCDTFLRLLIYSIVENNRSAAPDNSIRSVREQRALAALLAVANLCIHVSGQQDGTLTDPPSNILTMSPHDVVDSEIIDGLRQGDRYAWERLYDEYSENLWRYVSRLIGGNREAVAEVVQESFLAAAKGAKTFDETKGSLWAWLTGIAHRQCSAWFRKRSRIQKIVREDVQQRIQSVQGSHAESSAPVQILEDQEQIETVRAALSELSTEYSFLLTAKYMDRLTVEQIQDHIGGTSDSIRSKLRRARAEFRAIFERLNEGGPK